MFTHFEAAVLADSPRRHPLDHGLGKNRVDQDDRENRDHEAGCNHPDVELMTAREMHDPQG